MEFGVDEGKITVNDPKMAGTMFPDTRCWKKIKFFV